MVRNVPRKRRQARTAAAESPIAVLTRLVKDAGWWHDLDPEGNSLHMAFDGNHARYLCAAFQHPSGEGMVVCANFPFFVPEDRRSAVSELLMRIQGRSWIGRFEMDFAGGEVQVQVPCDIRYMTFSDEVGKHLLSFLTDQVDQCFPWVVRVAFGRETPMEVAAEALRGDSDEDGAVDQVFSVPAVEQTLN